MDQAKMLNELGHSCWNCGNLEAAQAAFEKLLDLAQRQECNALEATAWNNLAVIFREHGEWARATVCQQQSWRAAQSDNSADSCTDLLSHNLTNLANDAILAGDYRVAERLLRSALDVDVRMGNSADEAADWGGLGIVSCLTGCLDKARREFHRARRIHERLRDDRGLGCDLGHLGQISLVEEDWPAARNFIEQSLSHFERGGCRQLAEQARRTLHEIACRQRIAHFDPVRN